MRTASHGQGFARQMLRREALPLDQGKYDVQRADAQIETGVTIRRRARTECYCLVPLKVPSPSWPSDTLPLIELPSTLPVYFTASTWPCASTLYSMTTSLPVTVP